MSEYVIIKTKMRSIETLVKALETVMPKWKGKILVDPNGMDMYGYHGKNRSKLSPDDPNYYPPCQVRVDRKHIGSAANDLGFHFTEDGTLALASSAYDQGAGRGADFQKKIAIEYAKQNVDKNAAKFSAAAVGGTAWKQEGGKMVKRFKVKKKNLKGLA